MNFAILTARPGLRAQAALFALLAATLAASASLVGVAQAAPPAPLSAEGREAAAPGRVRRQSLETPIGQPGGNQPPTKQGAAKSADAGKTPIRLAPGDARSTDGDSSGGSSFVAVMASLAVVIGILLLVLWVMRRTLPGGTRKLPPEVVDVLGHAPLGNRQQAQLIRLGNKLLLVSVTATGAETLAEVTDPEEVERLTSLAGRPAASNPTDSFRQILRQFERKPTTSVAAAGKRPASAAPLPSAGQERARG